MNEAAERFLAERRAVVTFGEAALPALDPRVAAVTVEVRFGPGMENAVRVEGLGFVNAVDLAVEAVEALEGSVREFRPVVTA